MSILLFAGHFEFLSVILDLYKFTTILKSYINVYYY